MARRYLLYIVLFTAIGSCNKTEKAQKRISGSWKIVQYQFTNYTGLSYYYNAVGTLTFEDCGGTACPYNLDMTYMIDTVEHSKTMSGDYLFIDDKGEYYDLTKSDTSGTIDTIYNARVILVNKYDLKTEFTDAYGRHLFILQK